MNYREHDKNPEDFFEVLFQLHEHGYQFVVSVLGQTYSDVPGIHMLAWASTKSGWAKGLF